MMPARVAVAESLSGKGEREDSDRPFSQRVRKVGRRKWEGCKGLGTVLKMGLAYGNQDPLFRDGRLPKEATHVSTL
jgi:hypothetical protein